jgi:hypothetical protein
MRLATQGDRPDYDDDGDGRLPGPGTRPAGGVTFGPPERSPCPVGHPFAYVHDSVGGPSLVVP